MLARERQEETPRHPPEDAVVRDWRYQQFRNLGFRELDAFVLAARREIDLGKVRSLVDRGCDLSLALRIVL